MDIEEYRRRYKRPDGSSPGWDVITEQLERVYPGQEPQHWSTLLKYMLGGPDPIDGVSAYQCRDGGRDHLHLCTFGFSSLYYDEESVGQEFSGYGFEMTFRLASDLPPSSPPIWVCNLMQNLARYVFGSGKVFGEYHWIPANGPISRDHPTDLVGLAFLLDPTLPAVNTPNGRVEFVQAFGITQSELDAIMSKSKTCEEIFAHHRDNNPLLITDLARKNA